MPYDDLLQWLIATIVDVLHTREAWRELDVRGWVNDGSTGDSFAHRLAVVDVVVLAVLWDAEITDLEWRLVEQACADVLRSSAGSKRRAHEAIRKWSSWRTSQSDAEIALRVAAIARELPPAFRAMALTRVRRVFFHDADDGTPLASGPYRSPASPARTTERERAWSLFRRLLT